MELSRNTHILSEAQNEYLINIRVHSYAFTLCLRQILLITYTYYTGVLEYVLTNS